MRMSNRLKLVKMCLCLILIENAIGLIEPKPKAKSLNSKKSDDDDKHSFLVNTLPGPTMAYDSMNILIEPDVYVLYWSIVNNGSEIVFEVHAKTQSGWFSFGLSPNYGNFKGADLVVGWLNPHNLIGHFSHRHTSFESEYAFIATKQVNPAIGWLPLYVAKTNTHIIFKFKRKLINCHPIIRHNAVNMNITSSGRNLVNLVYTIGDNQLVGQEDDDVISLADRSLRRGSMLVDFFKQNQKHSNNLKCSKVITSQTNELDNEFVSEPTDEYNNYVELVANKYRVYWNVTDTKIIIELHVKTLGWIGFGLSPDGRMDNSDVMIGWVHDGVAYLTDRFIHGRRIMHDLNNDLNLLYSSELNGHTILKYERELVLCDPDDRTIEKGSPHVIYAWSDTDPISEEPEDLAYHSKNRGSKQLLLVNNLSDQRHRIASNQAQLEKIELKISNVLLPNLETFYYCKVFKIPSHLAKTKKHILKYELKLPNYKPNNIHHVFAYECVKSYDYDEKRSDKMKGSCFQAEYQKYCQSFGYVWTYGGATTTYMPKNAGYPIGGPDADYDHVLIEIHYNNPDHDKLAGFIDSISLSFYATANLERNELGILALGTYPDPFGILIPPKLHNFNLNTYCYADCIQAHLQDRNIRFVMATPHTHKTGRDVSTRLIRNNKDIGFVFQNRYYGFDFQYQYLIDPPVVLRKGDSLITTCKWTTLDRDFLTKGGHASQNEVCYQFLHYYPRLSSFKNCYSAPSVIDQSNAFSKLKAEGFIYYLNESTDELAANLIVASLYSAYDSLSMLNYFPRYLTNSLINLYHNSHFLADCNSQSTSGHFYAKIRPNKTISRYTQCELIDRADLYKNEIDSDEHQLTDDTFEYIRRQSSTSNANSFAITVIHNLKNSNIQFACLIYLTFLFSHLSHTFYF